MNLKGYILFIFSLFVSTVFSQELVLKTSVSKNKLGVNQRLRIQYEINKQGADNFKAPNFVNFKIVGGPSQSVSQSWINGRVSFSQSYTYVIQPKRVGEFVLPIASIKIDGKIIQSKPLKIIVTKAVDIPKNPNDPDYIAEQNIHLVAEVSKSNPYVGEGIYVEYRLYFSNNVGIYDNTITQSPKYNGFWNQEIKQAKATVKKATYNGQQYRYVVLYKALLIPTKSGKLTIDPVKMDIVVAVPTGKADFFGNQITRQVRKEFVSARKTVRSIELPSENKPINFSGAVGAFNYSVNLSKNELKANESSQIKVNVTGKGNLKLFELPKIKMVKELEVYEPERKEKTNITSTGIRGSITNTYTVVPQYKGKYKIPSTSFSYFNPKDKKYHTITINDLYVNVLEGKQLPKNTPKSSDNVTQQTVKSKGKNFRYIQTKSEFQSAKKSEFFKSTLFYILLFLPFMAIPIVFIINKNKEERSKDVKGNKLRKAERLAKKYLTEAEKNFGNKELFYESLERALYNYLKAKLNVETVDISKEKITRVLQDKKVNTDTISKFIEVLKDCDFARYTPVTNVEMQTEYQKAKQVIMELDKQL